MRFVRKVVWITGASSGMPLDVVSSDVADQIEVTKALHPDQEAGSIGSAANIRTRSAFSRAERGAALEAAATSSGLLGDYSGSYPYVNSGYKGAATFTDFLSATQMFGLAIEAKWRNRAYVKQRKSATGWNDTTGYQPGTATAPTLL